MALILVVDDTADIRNVLRIVLRKAGFVVVTADCGIDALQLLEQQKPDLMILDNHMPDLNGFEVMQRMQEPKPCVVMFSADSTPEMVAQAAQLGAAGYLIKAELNIAEFIKVVRSHIPEC